MSQQYKHYARAATHAKFTAILGSLPAALTPIGGVPPTTKDLARLSEKLQRLQQTYFEDHFSDLRRKTADGHDVHPLPFPRIPTKLFKNYSPDGPLQRIIHAAFTYRIKKAFRKWDVENPTKKELFHDMLRYIAEDLLNCSMITDPVLAFASDVSLEIRAELAPLATLMRAKVVLKITPAVTHVLHHADNNGEEEGDEGEWYRTLEKQDGHVLLHYWYKPDSADVWVPEASGDYLDPEPAPVHKGPWFLSTRWLRDSYKFLEWANEEDYERNGQEEVRVETDGRESVAPGVATPRTSSAPATVDGDESEEAPSDNDEEVEEEDDEEDEDDEDDDDDDDEEEGDDTISRKSHDDDRPRSSSVHHIGDGGKHGSAVQDGPKPHPSIRVVDLDQKGTRIRRYEYEPFKNAVLHNMSWTMGDVMPTGVASYAGDRRASPDQAWQFLEMQKPQPAIKKEFLPSAGDGQTNSHNRQPASALTATPALATTAPTSAPSTPPPPTPEPYTETPAELATHRIVNLAHAPWFAFDSVHPCEKLHFPEFFSQVTPTTTTDPSSLRIYPPRSAAAYLHIRNSLIVAFRRNMTRYLGVEEACTRLGERVEDVAKVLRFLTHWGLINLQV
ncbi:SWI SNF, matrix associated, actin dependent regulator of chromatin, sub c, member 2 [Geranomyces michiganensis]|nr:SWI SNF, matrix associated, actin dependent regulator of chromatin, sub c, member 2 [Geranomyces michiganensis]